MRKCEGCNHIYRDEFKWCPLCGTKTIPAEANLREIQYYIAQEMNELLEGQVMPLKAINQVRGLFLGMTSAILKSMRLDTVI